MGKLLTPKKAAEMMGVTTSCLFLWEQAGKISAIKTVGGHRRYKIDELNKLLGNNDKEVKGSTTNSR